MNATDSVFQRAVSNMLTELFDGPPGQEAYVLNTGDPGLLRQLDTIDAVTASKRPMPGKTTIAAHVDHTHYGLAILNRWAAGDADAWAGAD
jgi:phosphoketolase